MVSMRSWDALRRFAKLLHRQVARVVLGDVGRPGVVDQELGQGARKHQLALGRGDEGIAQSLEPEPDLARFADGVVEVSTAAQKCTDTGVNIEIRLTLLVAWRLRWRRETPCFWAGLGL